MSGMEIVDQDGTRWLSPPKWVVAQHWGTWEGEKVYRHFVYGHQESAEAVAAVLNFYLHDESSLNQRNPYVVERTRGLRIVNGQREDGGDDTVEEVP